MNPKWGLGHLPESENKNEIHECHKRAVTARDATQIASREFHSMDYEKIRPLILIGGSCCLSWLTPSSHGEETDKTRLPPTTPLTHAIRLERFDEARSHILPEWINTPDRGQYHPLTYAAYTTNNDLMRALLEAGADPNRVEENGKTALYVTANMANVEGLELLKEHGAVTPPNNALSPAITAVHSSSLECLAALLRIFPDTDLDRGWENRSDGGWLLVDSPGDPVAYAAYHGYDEMARFLLRKGARIVGKDALGQNALHHAAINPQCSADLVGMLIEHGCPPFSQSFNPQIQRPHVDQGPRSPLEFAALAGSFEKVEIMARSMDPEKHRDSIHRAAQVAAAHRQDRIAGYLMSFINESLPTYREFVGMLPRDPDHATDNIEPPDSTTGMDGLELHKMMLALSDDTDTGTGVSMSMITAETRESGSASMARNLNTLLPHMVGNTRGFTSLSRDQLQYLQLEKAIGIEDSYWAAAWVIDGGIGAAHEGKAELTLRAIHAMDKAEFVATRTVKIGELDEGLRQCWNALASKMTKGAHDNGGLGVEKIALEKEAEVLHRHANWLFEAGYHTEAGRLMEACLEFGNKTPERLKLALMNQLRITHMFGRKRYEIRTAIMSWTNVGRTEFANYGQMGMYADHYHFHPRSSSHELRILLLDSAEHFIRLGEIAEAQIRMNPPHENVYGWTRISDYDRDIEATLNPFASNALYILLHFATVIDHAMIHADPEDQRTMKDVHGQIERITTIYLDHLRKQKEKNSRTAIDRTIRTIKYLLLRDSDYFARYLPESLERMLALLLESIQAPTATPDSDLPMLYQLAAIKALSTREAGLIQASEAWWKFQLAIQSKCLENQMTLTSTAPLYRKTSRTERLDLLRAICAQPFSIREGSAERSVIGHHPIGNLVGMDAPLQRAIPSSAVESALLDDIDGLYQTAEYLRMAALYRAVNDLRSMSERSLAGFLSRRPEIYTGSKKSDSSIEWSHDAWQAIRSVLMDSRDLNPDIMKLLDQLCGEVIDNDRGGAVIDLSASEILVLPGQPGQSHRPFHAIPERAVITGNELWLPGFSIGKQLPWSEGETDSDNVLQVVSLEDRSVRTIVLPRLTRKHPHFGDSLGVSPNRWRHGRVAVSKDYAYHTPDGLHLFYIRRDDHEVGGIKIPPGFTNLEIQLVDAHPERKLLLLQARNRGGSSQDLCQVLLFNGKEVEKILVSNRRNPEQSPMDRADFAPGMMEFHGNSAWIGDSGKQLGHSYDLDSGEWSKLDKCKVNGMINRAGLKANYDHVSSLSDQLYARFNEGSRGINHGYWHMHTSYSSANLALPPEDDFMRHMLGHIRVKVPSIDHPAFQTKWFPQALPTRPDPSGAVALWPQDPLRNHYKGWWISPNDAILQELYRIVIIGKWRSFYLIGIKCVNMDKNSQPITGFDREYGVQALWLVSESDFQAAQKPLLERYSRLIDFHSAWDPAQWKNTARIDARNPRRDFRRVAQRPIEMLGGGSVFVIEPVIPIGNTRMVLQISRRMRDRKSDFTLEVGDEQNPTVVFDSKNHEIGTSDEYPMRANLYVPLPEGTPQIRLINHSPRDHSLRIHKILFMPMKE